MYRCNFINPPKTTLEKLSKKSKVEKAGYVPNERKISDMIQAGIRLQLAHAPEYDISDDSDPAVDPTRKPGIDLAEASILHRQARHRIRKQLRDSNIPIPKDKPTVPPALEKGQEKAS